MHQNTGHRILTDLGAPGAALNQKLTAWWELDFAGFLAQVRAALKREIPVRQRDDWEEWLTAQRRGHAQRTAAIVRLETQLNRRVYDLFDLTPAEVKIIEKSAKHKASFCFLRRLGVIYRLLIMFVCAESGCGLSSSLATTTASR